MTRLQEIDSLLDNNNNLIAEYSKRIATLISSNRELEKERNKITNKNKKLEVVRCKDCVKLNRQDCPMCYIENKTLQFAEVKPNFYCAKGRTTE